MIMSSARCDVMMTRVRLLLMGLREGKKRKAIMNTLTTQLPSSAVEIARSLPKQVRPIKSEIVNYKH
jgi:hypothetical protein